MFYRNKNVAGPILHTVVHGQWICCELEKSVEKFFLFRFVKHWMGKIPKLVFWSLPINQIQMSTGSFKSMGFICKSIKKRAVPPKYATWEGRHVYNLFTLQFGGFLWLLLVVVLLFLFVFVCYCFFHLACCCCWFCLLGVSFEALGRVWFFGFCKFILSLLVCLLLFCWFHPE